MGSRQFHNFLEHKYKKNVWFHLATNSNNESVPYSAMVPSIVHIHLRPGWSHLECTWGLLKREWRQCTLYDTNCWGREIIIWHNTYQRGLHVRSGIGSFHNCRPIHHEPVDVHQEDKYWVTLGFLIVHSGVRPGRPGCPCTPLPSHLPPHLVPTQQDWNSGFSKLIKAGHLGCILDTSASSSPSIKTILLLRLHAISVVCRVHELLSSQQSNIICTVVTMQRVTDPVVVAVWVEMGSKWFFTLKLEIWFRNQVFWDLCGGCQRKEDPGVANPKISSK